jgi:hypothetical protein
MKRTGGPKINVFTQTSIGPGRPVNHRIGHGQPLKCSGLTFLFKLVQNISQFERAQNAFPELAMECSYCLNFAVQATGHMIRGCKLADLFLAFVFQIKAGQITRIEIVHNTRSSRSSEIN